MQFALLDVVLLVISIVPGPRVAAATPLLTLPFPVPSSSRVTVLFFSCGAKRQSKVFEAQIAFH